MYTFSVLGGEGLAVIDDFDASRDTIHLTDADHHDGEMLDLQHAPVRVHTDADDLLLAIGDNPGNATQVRLRGLGATFCSAQSLSDLLRQGMRIELFN